MLAKNITIFSLPIDSQHHNVFDFSDKTQATGAKYYKALRSKFDYVVVKASDQDDVSIKSDKEFDICLNIPCESVAEFTKEYISKYNYLAMSVFPYVEENTYDTFLFYFITDWKIVNSVKNEKLRPSWVESGSVTVMFSLKWDVWANNLFSIQNQTNKMFFERKHIDDFKANTDKYGKRYITSNFSTDENLILKTHYRISQKRMGNRQDYTVVFGRVFFDTSFRKNLRLCINDSIIKIDRNDSYLSLANGGFFNMACGYFPLYVIDTKTRIIRSDFSFWFKQGNSNAFYLFEPDISLGTFNQFINELGDYFFYADLTVQCFDAYEIIGKKIVFDTYNGNGFYLSMFDDVDPDFNNETGNLDARYGFLAPYDKENIITRNTEVAYFVRYPNIDKDNKNIITKMELEPRIHCYPYEYYSVVVGQKTENIIPSRGVTALTIIENSNFKANPHFRILEESTREFSFYKTSSNSGTVNVAKDNYTNYMRTRKDQLNLNLMKSLIPSPNNTPIDMTFAISKAMIDEKSALNNADAYSINNSLAFDDLEIQDDLIIIENFIASEKEKEELFIYFNNYGIKVNEFDIIDATRQNFDYQKTRDCELQFIRDNADRIEVQNIFNNGVRRWHLDTCYNDALINCDTEYINLQNSLIES